jgi:hypothetical protein
MHYRRSSRKELLSFQLAGLLAAQLAAQLSLLLVEKDNAYFCMLFHANASEHVLAGVSRIYPALSELPQTHLSL